MHKLFLYYCGVEDIQQDQPCDAFAYQPPIQQPVAKKPVSIEAVPKSTEQVLFQTLADLKASLQQEYGIDEIGLGSTDADIMVIGDVPMDQAEQTLLEKMLAAIDLPLDKTYRTTLFFDRQKMQTASNRTVPSHIAREMSVYLKNHIELIKPKILLLLGHLVTKTLLQDQKGILSARGKILSYQNIAAMPMFSPSYLIKQPTHKRLAWQDLQKLQQWLIDA